MNLGMVLVSLFIGLMALMCIFYELFTDKEKILGIIDSIIIVICLCIAVYFSW